MKTYKIIIVTSLFMIISLVVSSCTLNQPNIEVETDWFDFGDVVNGKIVNKDMYVENTGETELIIKSVSTTCGCTKATMNEMSIPAGSRAVLSIAFDSGAHGPELTGEITRQVIIESNDPSIPEKTIEFVANILPRR